MSKYFIDYFREVYYIFSEDLQKYAVRFSIKIFCANVCILWLKIMEDQIIINRRDFIKDLRSAFNKVIYGIR